ncbi:MAG TPA: MarR family transcriptional regulator [Parvularculaceae bacterium]|nr:MarR family transcriptional regulator [Parvularculaceae bacterium]
MSKTANAPQANDVAGPGLILAEFLPYRLVSLGHLVSCKLSNVYAAENLTIPEWRVLAAVSQADAMAARDVAALTPMDKMAVSRAVAALEAKGLVERRPDARDRRVSLLALSTEGRALFERVADLALSYEARLLAALSPDEQCALKAALSHLERRAHAAT